VAVSIKRSISLSQHSSDQLEELMRLSRSDRSAVLEAAIHQLASLSDHDVIRSVREALDAKRAGTPSGWRSLFWKALAEAFALKPDAFAFLSNQPYGPRTLGGCQVVFLLPNLRGTEDGTLTVHSFEDPRAGISSSVAMTWHYELRQSPFDAARKTAEWINERNAHKSRSDLDATPQ
jgi:hypothetical protein